MKGILKKRPGPIEVLYEDLVASLRDTQRQCDEAMSKEFQESSSSTNETASQMSQQSTNAGSSPPSSRTSILDSQKKRLDELAEHIEDCKSKLDACKTDESTQKTVLDTWTQWQKTLSARIESLGQEIVASQSSLNTTPSLRRVDSFMSSASPSKTVSVSPHLNNFGWIFELSRSALSPLEDSDDT
jgi:small-conductance mechanosensitive channel